MRGLAPGGERGGGGFSDLGVGDEPLLVVVLDRDRVADRVHADSRIPEIAVLPAVFILMVTENRAVGLGGDQCVGDDPGRSSGGVGASRRSLVAAIIGAESGVVTTASNMFKPWPWCPEPTRMAATEGARSLPCALVGLEVRVGPGPVPSPLAGQGAVADVTHRKACVRPQFGKTLVRSSLMATYTQRPRMCLSSRWASRSWGLR